MKRIVKAGPKTCAELTTLLGNFEIDLAKGDRTEGHIAGELFRRFQMTAEQIKEVNFHEPTKEERRERKLSEAVTGIWNANTPEDLWSYWLSETECTVLEKVIRQRKGTYNFLRDAWEDVILTQLAGPLQDDKHEPTAIDQHGKRGRGRNKRVA